MEKLRNWLRAVNLGYKTYQVMLKGDSKIVHQLRVVRYGNTLAFLLMAKDRKAWELEQLVVEEKVFNFKAIGDEVDI